MTRRQVDPYFLMGVAGGAAALVVYVFWTSVHRRDKAQRPTFWPSSIADTALKSGLSHVYGSADAPYVLREISDFHCEGCAEAETTVVRVAKSLAEAKILQLIVFDIPSFDNAMEAVVAATCASAIEPSKYWAYRRLLFRSRDEWIKTYPPEPALLRMASSIGVDSVALKGCIETQGSRIARGATELAKTVARSGVYYTPAWSLHDSVFATAEIATRLRALQQMHQAP